MSQSDTLKANLSQGGTKEPVFPALSMSRQGNGPSQKNILKKRLAAFTSWKNPKGGFFLLLVVIAANIILATLAWLIVRLITG